MALGEDLPGQSETSFPGHVLIIVCFSLGHSSIRLSYNRGHHKKVEKLRPPKMLEKSRRILSSFIDRRILGDVKEVEPQHNLEPMSCGSKSLDNNGQSLLISVYQYINGII